MDPHIAQWIVEFLLRQPIEEHLVHPFLNVLALSDVEHRLMKTGLLRRIALEISNGTISENTLDSLEMIEQCDFENGTPVLDSMQEAYYAVGVHCAIRCLKEKFDDFRAYFDSVIKIWRGRIEDMEICGRVGLFVDRMKHEREMIEEALWNASVRDSIVRRDTLSDARKALIVFLGEVLEQMGPSFLEVAGKALNDMGKVLQVSSNPSLASLANQIGKKQVGSADTPSKECVNDGNSHNSAITMNHKGKQEQVFLKSSLSDQAGQKHMLPTDASSEGTHVSIRNHIGHGGVGMVGKDARMIPCTKKYAYKSLATPDVRKVQEALKSSTLDLQAVVNDPLPDALCLAATISSSLASEKSLQPVQNRNVVDMDVGSSSYDNTVVEAIHVKETITGNQCAGSRRNLLKRNSSACTFERTDEDPIMSTNEETPSYRPLLPPSERAMLVAPLRKYENGKIRRIGKRWSPEEEQALKDAVRECGRGNWKLIMEQYGASFQGRSAIDLKDKWRNLMK